MNNFTNHNVKEMLNDLKYAVDNKKSFSLICLGDAEQIFLACPEIETINKIDMYLAVSGVDSSMTKLKKEIIELLPKNDYIFSHRLSHKDCDPRVGKIDWAKFFYIYPEIFEYYKLTGIKIIDAVSLRYGMVTDGSLFDILSGKKVLLAGFHAPAVFERIKNPEFIKHYEKMNLHKINIVGAIGCSEFKKVGDEVYDMFEQSKKIDYDVALLGMGIPSCYLAPKMKEEGKIVLDIGHIMTAFSGKGEKHRSYISEFDYD